MKVRVYVHANIIQLMSDNWSIRRNCVTHYFIVIVIKYTRNIGNIIIHINQVFFLI